MKKFLAGMTLLLAAMGCTKAYMPFERSFTGTSKRFDLVGEHYMVELVESYLVDNLVALEDALKIDAVGLYEARENSDFQPDGKSLWTPGARWITGTVRALNGLLVEKMPEDSTWRLSRNDAYPLGGHAFPTEHVMTARMLKGTGASNHRWAVEIDLTRTEDAGYDARLVSVGTVVFDPGNTYWDRCNGTFLMEVQRDGKTVDRANLVYSGPVGNYRYLGGL